jgi:hypothetical protein
VLIVDCEKCQRHISTVLNYRFPKVWQSFRISDPQSGFNEDSTLLSHCPLLTGKYLQNLQRKSTFTFIFNIPWIQRNISGRLNFLSLNLLLYFQISEPLKFLRKNSTANHSDFRFSVVPSRALFLLSFETIQIGNFEEYFYLLSRLKSELDLYKLMPYKTIYRHSACS